MLLSSSSRIAPVWSACLQVRCNGFTRGVHVLFKHSARQPADCYDEYVASHTPAVLLLCSHFAIVNCRRTPSYPPLYDPSTHGDLLRTSLYFSPRMSHFIVSGSTYEAVEQNSREYWSIQNIELLAEMQDKFPNPPPLNIVAMSYRAMRWLYRHVRTAVIQRGWRKVHPKQPNRFSGDKQPKMKSNRRDIESLDTLIAFLAPHGVAVTEEMALLKTTR